MSGILAGLKIGLLTASSSRLGGGVFEAVVSHSRLIRAHGGGVSVFALRDAYSEEDRGRFGDVPVNLAEPAGPRQIGFAPDLARLLDHGELDCLHLHGIWMYPSAAGSAWAGRTRRPYYISPHGMLDPWITNRGRWKKAVARAAYERAGWRRATAIHALTSGEARDIERESGRRDSVTVPNPGPPAGERRAAMPGPVVVYVGRIHTKKNLLALVGGWTASRRPPGARLVLAGWGDDAEIASLQAAIAAGDGSVSFAGPVFGAEKRELLAGARFVALPSHSEGLPMAILEAWAEGIPTIMTAACNLPEGFAAGAALECGVDESAISRALTDALSMTAGDWLAMSQAARDLAIDPFSEQMVSARWATIYSEAIGAANQQGLR